MRQEGGPEERGPRGHRRKDYGAGVLDRECCCGQRLMGARDCGPLGKLLAIKKAGEKMHYSGCCQNLGSLSTDAK